MIVGVAVFSRDPESRDYRKGAAVRRPPLLDLADYRHSTAIAAPAALPHRTPTPLPSSTTNLPRCPSFWCGVLAKFGQRKRGSSLRPPERSVKKKASQDYAVVVENMLRSCEEGLVSQRTISILRLSTEIFASAKPSVRLPRLARHQSRAATMPCNHPLSSAAPTELGSRRGGRATSGLWE
jgi:hypothetical protein